MAENSHLEILSQGVQHWNDWRTQNPNIRPLLNDAPLNDQDLRSINLNGADLFGAHLCNTNLTGSSLHKAHLREAKLVGAHLDRCNLRGAHFREADLTRATITNADLSFATLVMAHLRGADFTGSTVYGISAWDIDSDNTTAQAGLVISKNDEPVITVDNLEVAQFISLLLNNRKIRDVIDTVTGKAVLILGRFTEQRKPVLNALREELRKNDYLPILFDFDKPVSKTVTGTVDTLARMARFIIADVTDPSSVPHELATIAPQLTTTPILPLRLAGTERYSMVEDLQRFSWVMTTYEYADQESLIAALPAVIAPAEALVKQLRTS